MSNSESSSIELRRAALKAELAARRADFKQQAAKPAAKPSRMQTLSESVSDSAHTYPRSHTMRFLTKGHGVEIIATTAVALLGGRKFRTLSTAWMAARAVSSLLSTSDSKLAVKSNVAHNARAAQGVADNDMLAEVELSKSNDSLDHNIDVKVPPITDNKSYL